jgi:hypothetical protein
LAEDETGTSTAHAPSPVCTIGQTVCVFPSRAVRTYMWALADGEVKGAAVTEYASVSELKRTSIESPGLNAAGVWIGRSSVTRSKVRALMNRR